MLNNHIQSMFGDFQLPTVVDQTGLARQVTMRTEHSVNGLQTLKMMRISKVFQTPHHDLTLIMSLIRVNITNESAITLRASLPITSCKLPLEQYFHIAII